MIEIFDEIEEFFQQKQFTQEQLDTLKESIEIKYKNTQTRKLANSAINIKLLQYKLSGPIEARIDRNVKRGKSLLSNKNSFSSNRLTKTERKKLEVQEKVNAHLKNSKKNVVDIFYEHNVNKPIKKAAIYLNMPLDEFLNRVILPNGVIINENSRLTEDVWRYNLDWISYDLNKNQEKFQNSERKVVKRPKKKSLSDGSVYDKLAKAKNIRTFIYTRM
ncbi:hypothetical protein D9V96_019495 [Zobellia laminariae]|uniref:hypothetical protein n=1 Tax=Zobellia laminariae TaxID=248906 RepID=UPI0012D93F34|nr:hypothetical protein [Zobellia laminariae]